MNRSLTIGSRTINDNSDCYVIAEIGHNHQGKLETAKEMFAAAKECGAHAVKLQKRNNRELFTNEMYNKPYESENSYGPTYGLHREALEFGYSEYSELKSYAAELGIDFFATAFDFGSADFLQEFDMPAYKIASGDLTNTPLLRYVASFKKPMIISTGGATMENVQRAYDTVMPINPQLCIMQCTAAYPCEFEEMNLRVITTYREAFPGAVIGLSAHDSGIAMSVAGYVLGSRMVEKHFTLNRAMKGTDHAFSLEKPGMQKLVRDLQRVRCALGDGVKSPYPSERAPLFKMSKKLVAVRSIPAGRTITRDDIGIKSPGDGIPPHELDKIVGSVAVRTIKPDENITYEAVALRGLILKRAS